MESKSRLNQAVEFCKKHKLWLIILLLAIVIIFSFFPSFKSLSRYVLDDKLINGLPSVIEDYPLNIHFMDVGKADAIIIRLDDETIMIDAGTPNKADEIEIYLKKLGVKKISHFFLTHPDSDHIGAAADVISLFDVEKVYRPLIREEILEESNETEAISLSCEETGTEKLYAYAGDEFSFGELKLEVLGPVGEHVEVNDYSLVIRLTYKNISVLFCGDVERRGEKQLVSKYGSKLRSDVIKIAHHGSNSSTTADFLEAVSPKYAVISTGKDSNNLPKPKVLKRLTASGVTTYRTDLHGSVVLSTDGDEIVFTKERGE